MQKTKKRVRLIADITAPDVRKLYKQLTVCGYDVSYLTGLTASDLSAVFICLVGNVPDLWKDVLERNKTSASVVIVPVVFKGYRKPSQLQSIFPVDFTGEWSDGLKQMTKAIETHC